MSRVLPAEVPPERQNDVYRVTQAEVTRRQPPPPDPSRDVVIHRGR